MTRRDLVDGLRALTDKQFVDVFYEAVQGRHVYSAERNLFDAQLVLANAVRDREERGRALDCRTHLSDIGPRLGGRCADLSGWRALWDADRQLGQALDVPRMRR